MSSGLLVTLLALGTWRLTRLVTEDDFPPVARARGWVLARAGRGREKLRWYGELISCPWCVSVHLAAGVTALAVLTLPGGLPAPFAVWGALAAVAALLEVGQRWLFGLGQALDVQATVDDALDDPAWRAYVADRLARVHSYAVSTPLLHDPPTRDPRTGG